MSAADRRLDAVADGLTARERAIIAISSSNRDEQPDERLIKYMPADQEDEFNRLVTAVEHAVDEFWSNCILWCEWINHADLEMAWLECLASMLDRESQLVAALKTHGVTVRGGTKPSRQSRRPALVLRPMRIPGRGFRRDVPLLFGTLVHEEPPPPEHWRAAVSALSSSVREAVEVRWKELAATEIVLAEMAEAFGADCCHQKLRASLDAVRAKLVELYEAIIPFTGSFSLPEPEEHFLRGTRDHVEWQAFKGSSDAIGDVTIASSRSWLKENDRLALEALEAHWKDEAQSLKSAVANDVVRNVPALPSGRRRSREGTR